jgi:hypothetical protein
MNIRYKLTSLSSIVCLGICSAALHPLLCNHLCTCHMLSASSQASLQHQQALQQRQWQQQERRVFS